jgi:hypothetical protein
VTTTHQQKHRKIMGDRKVLNKYIPADFDPSKIPRGKKLSAKDGTVPVRMMLPFSMQCSTCHNFLYRGRKFNSKKEPMGGGTNGTYLGIKRFRFYIKCTFCARSISFVTDPQHCDYEMEHGATRNYDVHKDKKTMKEQNMIEQAKKEELDPLAALEQRVEASQREMAEHDALEHIRALNAQHVKIESSSSSSSLLNDPTNPKPTTGTIGLTQDDEDLIKSIRFRNTGTRKTTTTTTRTTTTSQRPMVSVVALGGENIAGIKHWNASDEIEFEKQQQRQNELRMLEQRQHDLLNRTTATKNHTAGVSAISTMSSTVAPITTTTTTTSATAAHIVFKKKRKIESHSVCTTGTDTTSNKNEEKEIDATAESPIVKAAGTSTALVPSSSSSAAATATTTMNGNSSTGSQPLMSTLLGGYESDSD